MLVSKLSLKPPIPLALAHRPVSWDGAWTVFFQKKASFSFKRSRLILSDCVLFSGLSGLCSVSPSKTAVWCIFARFSVGFFPPFYAKYCQDPGKVPPPAFWLGDKCNLFIKTHLHSLHQAGAGCSASQKSHPLTDVPSLKHNGRNILVNEHLNFCSSIAEVK